MNATFKICDTMDSPYNPAARYSVAALDLLDDEVFLLDASTFSIVHANRAAIENTGYSAAELLWRNIFDIKPGASGERLKDELLSLREQNTYRRDYSLMQMRKDGSIYDTEESLHVLDHGDRAVIMLVVNDVTERRQADEMMLGGWEHATAILDSVGDPVIATDAGGVIVRVNHAAAELVGIPVFDAVGTALDELIRFRYPRTGEALQDMVGTCLRNGKQTQLDLLTFSTFNDKTERMVNLSLAPVSCGGGNVLGCVVTFRDIA